MRKIAMAMVFALVLVVVGTASATVVEIGRNGGLEASVEDPWWTKTPTKIDQAVLAYGDAWKEAYKKPGHVVPVETHEEYLGRDGFFHYRLRTVSHIGIVCDKNKTGIHIEHKGTAREQRVFSLFPLLWLVSLACMLIVTIILFGRRIEKIKADQEGWGDLFATSLIVGWLAALVAGSVSLLLTYTFTTSPMFAGVTFFTFSAVILVAVVTYKSKSYRARWLVGSYSVCMVAALCLYLWS